MNPDRPVRSARARLPSLSLAPLVIALCAPSLAALEPVQRADEERAPSDLRRDAAAVPLRALERTRMHAFEARAECFDAERWRARLTDVDLDRRECAFQELVRALARCAEAVNVAETWASSLSEPELGWTARLALREARRQPVVLVLPTAVPGELQSVSIDPSEPLALHGRLRSLGSAVQEGIFERGPFLSLYAPRLISFQSPKAESSRSFSLEMGREAVTLRILEGEAGTREFEAESLESLLREHPELADEVPGLEDMAQQPLGEEGGLLRWGTGVVVRLRFDPHGWRTPPAAVRLQGWVLDGAEPPTQLLGIDCRQVSPEERARSALEAGVGLRVERTIPGTLAYEIELRRGDILLRIGERTLHDCEDIRRALAERTPGQPLSLELVDTSGQRRTIHWSPSAKPR